VSDESIYLCLCVGRNGGWCMHDEATVHYIDMIDQTTLGHRFIKDQFNTTPRAGWQIDPFGHSAVQGYLLGAEVSPSIYVCVLFFLGKFYSWFTKLFDLKIVYNLFVHILFNVYWYIC
jgi:hypothetical protein